MKAVKRKRLERAGWAIGDAADFLRLSDQEAALVEMKLALRPLLDGSFAGWRCPHIHSRIVIEGTGGDGDDRNALTRSTAAIGWK